MLPLILLLIALGVVAAVAGLVRQWWYGRQVRAGIVDQMPEVRQGAAIGCCGQHETCEKDSLLAAVSKGIEYYEDEELDRFRGHPSSGYDAAAIEEFTTCSPRCARKRWPDGCVRSNCGAWHSPTN